MLWSPCQNVGLRDVSSPHITSLGCPEEIKQNKTVDLVRREGSRLARGKTEGGIRTWDSVGADSSSLSGAAPREAPGRFSPVPMPRRLAKFSSRFAFRISTCCSSRRRRSSSGLKVFFALNWVRRCSGMYRSAMMPALSSLVLLGGRSGSDCCAGVE